MSAFRFLSFSPFCPNTPYSAFILEIPQVYRSLLIIVLFPHSEDVILITPASVIPTEKSAGAVSACSCLLLCCKACTFSSGSREDCRCLGVQHLDSVASMVTALSCLTSWQSSASYCVRIWNIFLMENCQNIRLISLTFPRGSQPLGLQLLILQPSNRDKNSLGSSEEQTLGKAFFLVLPDFVPR